MTDRAGGGGGGGGDASEIPLPSSSSTVGVVNNNLEDMHASNAQRQNISPALMSWCETVARSTRPRAITSAPVPPRYADVVARSLESPHHLWPFQDPSHTFATSPLSSSSSAPPITAAASASASISAAAAWTEMLPVSLSTSPRSMSRPNRPFRSASMTTESMTTEVQFPRSPAPIVASPMSISSGEGLPEYSVHPQHIVRTDAGAAENSDDVNAAKADLHASGVALRRRFICSLILLVSLIIIVAAAGMWLYLRTCNDESRHHNAYYDAGNRNMTAAAFASVTIPCPPPDVPSTPPISVQPDPDRWSKIRSQIDRARRGAHSTINKIRNRVPSSTSASIAGGLLGVGVTVAGAGIIGAFSPLRKTCNHPRRLQRRDLTASDLNIKLASKGRKRGMTPRPPMLLTSSDPFSSHRRPFSSASDLKRLQSSLPPAAQQAINDHMSAQAAGHYVANKRLIHHHTGERAGERE